MSDRQGKWGRPGTTVPAEAERMLTTLKNSPDTDWMQSGEWFGGRLYDDADTGQFIVTRVVHTEDGGSE